MRPFGSPMQLEQRRLRAVTLFEKGFTPVDIARQLGVDRRSVRRWKSAFLQDGREAVKAKPVSGRPSKLDLRHKQKLEKFLLRGAAAVGYTTDLWTCPRVADVIRKRFGIEYHVRYVPRLLRSLGWTPQKPERRARERDEDTIRRWTRTTWPRIKKKPRGARPISSL